MTFMSDFVRAYHLSAGGLSYTKRPKLRMVKSQAAVTSAQRYTVVDPFKPPPWRACFLEKTGASA
jgi:hypothetical protein